jgi:hypothetical protein
MLTSSQIQAGTSKAEIRYSIDRGELTDAKLVFSFSFLNSGSNPVSLTNITSRLVINGVWEVSAACNPFVPNWNNMYLDSNAVLRIVEFWSGQPPIFPPEEDGQETNVAFFEIEGGLCETDPPGKNEVEWILNKGYDVRYSSLEVRPKGVVLFEVLLAIETHIFGGGNLGTVNSSIVCPFVQFEARETIQGPPFP